MIGRVIQARMKSLNESLAELEQQASEILDHVVRLRALTKRMSTEFYVENGQTERSENADSENENTTGA